MLKSPRSYKIAAVVIMGLIAIGFIEGLRNHTWQMLLPILVLGGIFLLYKYPPAFLRGGQRGSDKHINIVQSRATAAKMRRERPRSKTVPFKVIEGGKDDDDLPKYH